VFVKSEIKSKIQEFVQTYFLEGTEIVLKDDTSFLDEGILDSTGVIELVAFVEETFGFRIEDEEIQPDNFDSVNKLLVFVESKLASNT
jgi:acyl carrier protein